LSGNRHPEPLVHKHLLKNSQQHEEAAVPEPATLRICNRFAQPATNLQENLWA